MAHSPDHSGDAITIQKVQPFGEGAIVLTTPSLDADGHLEDRHSAYHENRSPPLVWTPVEGAAAYAIVVEDPDAPRERPFVHWLMEHPGRGHEPAGGPAQYAQPGPGRRRRPGRQRQRRGRLVRPASAAGPRPAPLPLPDLRPGRAAELRPEHPAGDPGQRPEGRHPGRRRAGGDLRGARGAVGAQAGASPPIDTKPWASASVVPAAIRAEGLGRGSATLCRVLRSTWRNGAVRPRTCSRVVDT